MPVKSEEAANTQRRHPTSGNQDDLARVARAPGRYPVAPLARKPPLVLTTLLRDACDDVSKELSKAVDRAGPGLAGRLVPSPHRGLIGSDFEFDVPTTLLPHELNGAILTRND